ncbi:MAG: peptidoglycan recognition protein family protein [Pseudonocardiaceae bacterium]
MPVAEAITDRKPEETRSLRRTLDTAQFAALGVNWRKSPASAISVALRTKKDKDSPWSPWHVTTAEETGGTGDRDGTGLIWTGPATKVDVVVTTLRGPAPEQVRSELIDPGRRAADAEQQIPKVALKAGNAQLNVRNRAAWGADEKKMTWKPEYTPKVNAVVIHHTATTTDYKADQVPAILRSIYRYQAVERGWGDIGYNIVVDKFGRAWEGRAGGVAKAVVGAHAAGFNRGTVGITLIGNYVNSAPTKQALDTLSQAIAYKLGPPKIDPTSTINLSGGPGPRFKSPVTIKVPAVIGHYDVGRTACPGKNLDAALPKLRQQAKTILSA